MLSITLLLAVILLAAAALVIGNARQAVAQEMHATVALAATLISGTLPAAVNKNRLLQRLGDVEGLRHLCVQPATVAASNCPQAGVPDTPIWFAALIRPGNAPARRLEIAGSDAAILIQADPSDEIAEVWADVRGLLGLILLFYLITLALVFRSLGRTITPAQRISAALADVEHGVFDRRLPAFNLPEFDRIVSRFNLMSATLERTRAENRRLHRHALRIQEIERARLARELHDELGQSLTAIRADAAGILARPETLPRATLESAQAIVEVAGRVYDQTRAMMRRLRPPGLDELGLAAAPEENVTGWRRQRPDIDYQLDFDGDLGRIDSDLAIHLFRIVQESLNNAHRHACPSAVTIRLALASDGVRVTVGGNGKGFDTDTTPPGLGLSGMRERAELLEGSFTVTSSAGAGTRVQTCLPRGRACAKTGSLPIEASE